MRLSSLSQQRPEDSKHSHELNQQTEITQPHDERGADKVVYKDHKTISDNKALKSLREI